jgi:hypothetical protein
LSFNNIADLPLECAYCGSNENLTKEHVIPRSFEAENAANWEPVIVWACSDCNGEKSKLDSKVRDLFAIDIFGGKHDTAQKLMAGKIKRSVQRSIELGHRNVLLELAKSMSPDRIVGADGIVLAEGMGTKLSDDPFTPWFSLVIRGIAMALSNTRFAEAFDLDLGRYYPDSYGLIREQLQAIGAPDPVVLGSHTKFTYRTVDGASTGFGVWVFQFYGGVVFAAFVTPKGMIPKVEE